ncbi:hypothetical protein [Candidatus Deianiraea vastatrix]|uniref:Uncharacterized protein n=1 Tax=Candidatus Deianiraea vastatrix TaxID=2163644 RepID=A0A5B8XJ23_9RICK|nr:hypothetical protein [Candidatus Deianiraea vastatrix]QED23617.1 hypothetical protein Deia_00830 [Candidatus Deianiraea vastatrix]
MKSFLKKYWWALVLLLGACIWHFSLFEKLLTLILRICRHYSDLYTTKYPKDGLPYKDIAWADWFGTVFSAGAMIFLWWQIREQKKQFEEQQQYNRSMEVFKIVQKNGDSMKEKLDIIIWDLPFQFKEGQNENTNEQNDFMQISKVYGSIGNFIKSCLINFNEIRHSYIKKEFQRYVVHMTSTPMVRQLILHNKYCEYCNENEIECEYCSAILYKYLFNKYEYIDNIDYISFFILFYRKEDLKINAPWLYDLCENWIKDEIKTGKLAEETKFLQHTEKWLKANTVDKNGWFGKD